MITGKSLALAILLAAVPFTTSAVSAQNQRTNPTNSTMQARDHSTTDRSRPAASEMRDQGMRDRDMHHRDDRDMRHYGWRRGHHYGWHRCMMRGHHHHRVRVCR